MEEIADDSSRQKRGRHGECRTEIAKTRRGALREDLNLTIIGQGNESAIR
jgi:hypothetical protein